jgi:hypothetical protein
MAAHDNGGVDWQGKNANTNPTCSSQRLQKERRQYGDGRTVAELQ